MTLVLVDPGLTSASYMMLYIESQNKLLCIKIIDISSSIEVFSYFSLSFIADLETSSVTLAEVIRVFPFRKVCEYT